MLEKSILVVVHPDNARLSLSSILSAVGKVVIRFLGSARSPNSGQAIESSINTHSIKNIIVHGIDQSDSFNGADWYRPVFSKYEILAIREEVRKVPALPVEELERLSRGVLKFTRSSHARKIFFENYIEVLREIIDARRLGLPSTDYSVGEKASLPMAGGER